MLLANLKDFSLSSSSAAIKVITPEKITDSLCSKMRYRAQNSSSIYFFSKTVYIRSYMGGKSKFPTCICNELKL